MASLNLWSTVRSDFETLKKRIKVFESADEDRQRVAAADVRRAAEALDKHASELASEARRLE